MHRTELRHGQAGGEQRRQPGGIGHVALQRQGPARLGQVPRQGAAQGQAKALAGQAAAEPRRRLRQRAELGIQGEGRAAEQEPTLEPDPVALPPQREIRQRQHPDAGESDAGLRDVQRLEAEARRGAGRRLPLRRGEDPVRPTLGVALQQDIGAGDGHRVDLDAAC